MKGWGVLKLGPTLSICDNFWKVIYEFFPQILLSLVKGSDYLWPVSVFSTTEPFSTKPKQFWNRGIRVFAYVGALGSQWKFKWNAKNTMINF